MHGQGWKKCSSVFEPIPALDDAAIPEELLVVAQSYTGISSIHSEPLTSASSQAKSNLEQFQDKVQYQAQQRLYNVAWAGEDEDLQQMITTRGKMKIQVILF